MNATIQALYTALSTRDEAVAESLMAADFMLIRGGRPFTAGDVLVLYAIYHTAFPDLKLVISDCTDDRFTLNMSGTHGGILELMALDMDITLRPTGQHIDVTSAYTYRLEGTTVLELHEQGPGTVQHLLGQLAE
jgi:hypothetical protein